MNLVVRMAIPIAVASCAIVIGLVSAMLGSSTPVAAQNEPATSAYITVEITAGDDTVSWSDPDECSSDYNIYKRSSRDSGGEIPRTHLGSATSGSTEATLAISDSSYSTIITLELYCGTYDSDSSDNELVASTEVRSGREGTYSSAPLTALTLSSGTLTPDFDRGFEWAGILTPDFDIEWGGYTAEVASDVEVITLDPTVLTGYQTDFIKDPGWGIVGICGGEHDDCIYGYGGGYILSDADPDTEGFQINLDRGENRLGIGVNTGSLKVNLGELYRLTVTVQNSPATGVPTISGTAQVWETLTADTSGIADVDGLNDVAFTYQWLADDTEIDGATSSTTRSRRPTPTGHQGEGQFYRRRGLRGVPDQRGDRRGGSEHSQHWSTHHHGHGRGGRDAYCGHVRHRGRGWVGQRYIHLSMDSQRSR